MSPADGFRYSLVHRLIPAGAAGPAPLVVLLHGYGSNEGDLISLAPLLGDDFLVASPRAPIVLAPGSYAWFDLQVTDRGMQIDPAQGQRAADTIVHYVQELCQERPVDLERIYLIGFSQGAMLTAAIALGHPNLLAGAVLMSGTVVTELTRERAPSEALAGLPMLAVHGTWDTVLPIELGRAGRDLLAGLPVSLEYHEFGMGHEVTRDSIECVRQWLHSRLGEPRRSVSRHRDTP